MNNRNKPCPCGSGEKFKKCCIPKQRPTIAQIPPLPVVEPFDPPIRMKRQSATIGMVMIAALLGGRRL